MKGRVFVAEVIRTGSALGFGVGTRLEEATLSLPLDYVDDVQGRGKDKVLRRDYGILEVTCGQPSDWVVQTVSVQMHRLASLPDLRRAVSENLQIDCEPYTSWQEVAGELKGHGDVELVEPQLDYSGYRVVSARSTGVSAYVVKDPEVTRGVYPADGDLWSLEIMSPQFMP
ncbi:hypothetical protein ACFUAC_30455 [Streptomyces sp. NPDC057148]|uniref:hypothetical protein n=1 Tax=unclassified Streptomyces TaxID=2593676 RepID=UPI00234947CD|nr:hypothetical protein [Streptomyces sp. M92]WCN07329.1 hypothetical protein M6G08_21850 [Streptomyces sp. M92]